MPGPSGDTPKVRALRCSTVQTGRVDGSHQGAAEEDIESASSVATPAASRQPRASPRGRGKGQDRAASAAPVRRSQRGAQSAPAKPESESSSDEEPPPPPQPAATRKKSSLPPPPERGDSDTDEDDFDDLDRQMFERAKPSSTKPSPRKAPSPAAAGRKRKAASKAPSSPEGETESPAPAPSAKKAKAGAAAAKEKGVARKGAPAADAATGGGFAPPDAAGQAEGATTRKGRSKAPQQRKPGPAKQPAVTSPDAGDGMPHLEAFIKRTVPRCPDGAPRPVLSGLTAAPAPADPGSESKARCPAVRRGCAPGACVVQRKRRACLRGSHAGAGGKADAVGGGATPPRSCACAPSLDGCTVRRGTTLPCTRHRRAAAARNPRRPPCAAH